MKEPDELEPRASLGRDLAHLSGAPVSAPRELDDAVLAEARRVLAPAPRDRSWRFLLQAVPVAASALFLVAVAAFYLSRRGADEGERVARAPEDLDGSGRVDVLDAYLLARRLAGAEGGGVQPDWDVTGDGAVDERDVEAVVARAVRVDG